MNQMLFMCLDAGTAAVLLIPFFIVMHNAAFHSLRRTFIYFVLAVYLCGVYSVVGLPHARYIRFDMNISLIPFRYFFSNLWNHVLNIFLFIPLGFFLTVLLRRYGKLHHAFLFGFLLSASIELLQIFTYRATDINDLMTNTLGTVIGWCLGKVFLKVFPSITPSRQTKELFNIFLSVFTVMFFLHPFLADWLLVRIYPLWGL